MRNQSSQSRRVTRSVSTRVETLEARAMLSASTLDTSFNSTGKLLASFGTGATFASVVTLSDGRILAAGTVNNGSRKDDFLVARYNTNGTPDTTLGNGTGHVFTDFGSSNDEALKLMLVAGGKFVVVGTSSIGSGNFAVARYNANGSLDTSFSSDGKVTTDFSLHFDQAGAAVLLSDGKLLVIGETGGGTSSQPDVAFARYTTSGALDTTFGGGTGKKVVDVAGIPNYVVDAAVIPTGQILVTLDDRFTVARFTSSCDLDTTFAGGDGFVRGELRGEDVPSCMAVLSNGQILVGGFTDAANEFSDRDFAVMRFNSTGTIDTTFGPESNGYTLADMGGVPSFSQRSEDTIKAINVQPNGKILAVGVSDKIKVNGESNILTMARFTAGGILDTSFSSDGKLGITGIDAGIGATLTRTGKTVVVGFAGTQAAVLRFGSDFSATASIAGSVYNDLNGNGTRNTGEPGLSAWQVFVDSNKDGFYTAGETVATTDSNGNYKLTGLLPGTYRIREVRLTNWNRTQPAGVYPLGFYDVTLSTGQAVTAKNFGNKHA